MINKDKKRLNENITTNFENKVFRNFTHTGNLWLDANSKLSIGWTFTCQSKSWLPIGYKFSLSIKYLTCIGKEGEGWKRENGVREGNRVLIYRGGGGD